MAETAPTTPAPERTIASPDIIMGRIAAAIWWAREYRDGRRPESLSRFNDLRALVARDGELAWLEAEVLQQVGTMPPVLSRPAFH